MEVLSNREICILLKILSDKKIKEGLSSTLQVDKNFSSKELGHIQKEIALAENKTTEEVLTIENTYKNILGENFHSGYKLNIINYQSFISYAKQYIEKLIQEDLIGYTTNCNLSTLIQEFYITIKNTSNIDDCTTNDIKYMPVILFAYVNGLIELKSLFLRKYNLRCNLDQEILKDDIFNQKMDDTLGFIMRMDACELFQNFDEYINTCDQDKKKFLESIQSFVDTFNKKKVNADKPKSTAQVVKSRNHMKPQQWKIFISLKKEVDKHQINSDILDIQKDVFITLGIFGKETSQQDTAISRFNSDYNKIIGNSKKEYEKIIWTKVSDTKYYQFSISKVTCLYNHIINTKKNDNNTLFEEFQKYKHFLNLGS